MARKSSSPSVSQLQRAVEIARQIEKLERELAGILGGSAPAARSAEVAESVEEPSGKKRNKRKRKMSPEARERIAAAQRARWAKFRKK